MQKLTLGFEYSTTASRIGTALWLTVALLVKSAFAADPVPLADFFRQPVVASPVMSPSGKYVAAALKGGPQGRMRLVVLNPQEWSQSKLVAAFSDADIQSIRWVNDDRLVFTLNDAQATSAEQWGQGLYAVDREGKEAPLRLIKRRDSFVVERTSRRELSSAHRLHSVLRDGSNDVVVTQYVFDARNQPSHVNLLRLDTMNGSVRVLSGGAPEHAKDWAIDPQGRPRAAVSSHDGKAQLYWKASADAPWTKAREYEVYGIDAPLRLLAWHGDDVLFAVTRATPDADTASLVRLALGAPTARLRPLVELQGYDFAGALVFGANGEILGVRYLADEAGTHWFDARLKVIQLKVDALLPNTNNRIDCGDCREPQLVLVSAASDRQPSQHLLFDVQAGTVKLMTSSHPWISAAAMAPRELLRLKARDGLSIPVHVTRPPGQHGAAPMVVLVHGGPWSRSTGWAWDASSQFLASRGYVVVEPDFRGSTGFGAKHYRAGWKQWGLAMQDDIADTARWAIAQGYADPKRICIAGASYGGYATLMGLIRDPELFRCGVEWLGVSDIAQLYNTDGFDDRDWWLRGMPLLVGDPVKDAAQFAATSPQKLAAKLTQPLLMAYGGADRRVPIDQGTRMRDALKPHNPNVEWISYPDEGHGWLLEANRIDFWSRVEGFLDRHLKNAP